jgi:hypothetical protein
MKKEKNVTCNSEKNDKPKKTRVFGLPLGKKYLSGLDNFKLALEGNQSDYDDKVSLIDTFHLVNGDYGFLDELRVKYSIKGYMQSINAEVEDKKANEPISNILKFLYNERINLELGNLKDVIHDKYPIPEELKIKGQPRLGYQKCLTNEIENGKKSINATIQDLIHDLEKLLSLEKTNIYENETLSNKPLKPKKATGKKNKPIDQQLCEKVEFFLEEIYNNKFRGKKRLLNDFNRSIFYQWAEGSIKLKWAGEIEELVYFVNFMRKTTEAFKWGKNFHERTIQHFEFKSKADDILTALKNALSKVLKKSEKVAQLDKFFSKIWNGIEH